MAFSYNSGSTSGVFLQVGTGVCRFVSGYPWRACFILDMMSLVNKVPTLATALTL